MKVGREKIDQTLDQLDVLLKTLPIDYQMDWIQEKHFDLLEDE
jgi:hypothetical protein